jgi:DNA-binding Lrp family transcriptional regulator
MILTKRDTELLKKLSSYGMLATNQLRIIVFGDIAVTTVLRRLRILEKNKLIKRIEGLSTTEKLWALTEKGAEVADVKLFKRHFAKGFLEHDYKLLAVRLALEEYGIAHSWTPEHEIRSLVYKKYGLRDAKDKLIPDGLIGIEVSGIKVSVVLELELNLKSARRYYHLFNRYQNIRDMHGVWYIVANPSQGNQLYKLWKKFNGHGSGMKLYISLLDEVLKNPTIANLFLEGKNKKLVDQWTAVSKHVPAHDSAQRVSIINEKINPIKVELTKENHAPILKEAC